MMYYNYFDPFHGLYHVFGIVIFIFIIVFILKAVRGSRHHSQYFHGHRDTAMDILRERYAKGDISKEEFESRKKDLMSQ